MKKTVDDAEDLDLEILMNNLLESRSNYSDTTDEATDFNYDTVYNNNFKSFDYNTKLLGSTVADELIGVLANAKITVPLKYLSNFWKSLKVQLINCKVAAAGADNTYVNPSKIVFTIKDTKLYVPALTLSLKKIKNYQNVLAKYLKDQYIAMNIKQEVRI